MNNNDNIMCISVYWINIRNPRFNRVKKVYLMYLKSKGTTLAILDL